MSATEMFLEKLEDNRAGVGGVAVSVCSAHELVLRAAMRSAARYDTFALIESTSNQVDQYGGYTGMTPKDFVRLVHSVANSEGFPTERILLGGDHLGPNTWRSRPSKEAMIEACKLVEQYVEAGYRKIHLDASFVCADDIAPLSEDLIAQRCVEMAKVAEFSSGNDKPIYVIGTEVPTPGGVKNAHEIHKTTPDDVERTVQIFRDAFWKNNLREAWDRVVALVIQPGVEFGDAQVDDYEEDQNLTEIIVKFPRLVYEAHSTDYQSAAALHTMTHNHFYVLKVGPWLTFALREGLFALESIEKELGVDSPSQFREVLNSSMKADSKYWKGYYAGSSHDVDLKLAYSYSDRCRYYLGNESVKTSIDQLFHNLQGKMWDGLISQYLPLQYNNLRSKALDANPKDFVINKISNILDLYHQAGA